MSYHAMGGPGCSLSYIYRPLRLFGQKTHWTGLYVYRMAISSYLLHLPPLAFAILILPLVTAQFTCSPTQPCSIGCCTKFGSCGLGPDSCGPQNCISNCDRKSDCDPGWGPQWSTAESCPLNVCCSKFGFCSTTPDFCGNALVTPPSGSGSSSSERVIGYYESWSVGRP